MNRKNFIKKAGLALVGAMLIATNGTAQCVVQRTAQGMDVKVEL